MSRMVLGARCAAKSKARFDTRRAMNSFVLQNKERCVDDSLICKTPEEYIYGGRLVSASRIVLLNIQHNSAHSTHTTHPPQTISSTIRPPWLKRQPPPPRPPASSHRQPTGSWLRTASCHPKGPYAKHRNSSYVAPKHSRRKHARSSGIDWESTSSRRGEGE